MRIVLLVLFTVFSNKAHAAGDCDLLGSLEADPLSIVSVRSACSDGR